MKAKLFYLLLFMSSITLAQIPTNGLLVKYDFPNGNLTTLTQNGTALISTNDRFGVADNAISLNGDYLTRPNLVLPNKASISFWVKTTTSDGAVKTIIDDANARNSVADNVDNWSGYYFALQSGKISLTVQQRFAASNIGKVGQKKVSTKTVADGNWHHVLATIDLVKTSSGQYRNGRLIYTYRTTANLYIDNVLDQTIILAKSTELGFWSNGNWDNNGKVTIANNRSNSFAAVNRYNDDLDEVLFYNRILSTTEIDAIYNVNSACLILPINTISAINITSNSADISIVGSDTYDVAYHKSSETFSNATIINSVTTNSVSLINLVSQLEYKVYIKKQGGCAGWSDSMTFNTIRPDIPYYVKKNASGLNDGSSWANAFTDLQTALNSIEDNAKVWIAQGTYTPHASDRNVHFAIDKSNVQLYGGFIGTETALSQRDFRTNETILSGDLSGNDVGTLTGNNKTDNAYNIIKVNQNGTTIDGFTISDGYAAGSGDQAVGAAIFKKKIVKSITVKNCIIKNNVADYAAGVFAEYTSSGIGTLDIENSIFDNNLARHSTSFSAWARTSGTFTFKVSNSLFINNEARDLSGTGFAASAGWLRAIGNSATNVNVSLVNNTYAKNNDIGNHSSMNNFNRATVGASKDNGGDLTLIAANNIFWDNTIAGGAVAKSISGIHTTLGQVTVSNSIDQEGFSRISSANLTNTSTSDPLFVNNTSDFTLQSTSPAINLGDNSYLPSSTTTDLSGNNRISIATVDAGAYEYQCTTCFGISINKVGNGNVIQNTGPVYNSGDTVTLTASNTAGWEFLEWSGDASGNANPLTFTINSNRNITATFIRVPVYVDKNATGNNDGTSWTDAFTDLQNVLLNTVDDAEIWVAKGTYTSVSSNRSTSFNIVNNGVKIYGGFAGTENQLSERDLLNNNTILSGDINGDDTGVSFTGNNRGENMHHVVRINANDVVLDGLIINDGQANTTANGELDYAGAVYVGDVVNGFTIKNSKFNNNVGIKGGAIRAYFANNAAVIIENSEFNNNLSQYGSGAYILANTSAVVSVDITNSLFANNNSANVSSSIKGYTGSSLWIRANTVNSSVTTNINNCTFAKNSDLGTQSGTERGTLGLGKRTDGNSTHIATINNSIFFSNQTTSSTTPVTINKGHTAIASITISNSIDEYNFQNITTGKTNTSNANPLFTDEANNDFTLTAGSPAINTGDNSKVPTNITKDLLGNVRIFNTTVDMGVYEFGSAPLGADNFSFSENQVIIYPNPTTSVLNIKMNSNLKRATIYSVLGTKVLETSSKNINASNLKRGIYLIKIENENGSISTKRFMKE